MRAGLWGNHAYEALYLLREAPAAAHRGTWLPTPAGDFRPVMRMFQPGAPLLVGSYRRPPIKRVD